MLDYVMFILFIIIGLLSLLCIPLIWLCNDSFIIMKLVVTTFTSILAFISFTLADMAKDEL